MKKKRLRELLKERTIQLQIKEDQLRSQARVLASARADRLTQMLQNGLIELSVDGKMSGLVGRQGSTLELTLSLNEQQTKIAHAAWEEMTHARS